MDSKGDLLSDDKILHGNLSFEEIELRYSSNQNERQTIAASELAEKDDCDMSLQLISTQSEPDITKGMTNVNSPERITRALSNVTLSPSELDAYTSCENSFQTAKMVEQTCNSSSNESLDNTLAAIEKILNAGPSYRPQQINESMLYEINDQVNKYAIKLTTSKDNNSYTSEHGTDKYLKSVSPAFTPVKQGREIPEVIVIPSPVLVSKPSPLKTPAIHHLVVKPSTSSVKKTPSKTDAFKHVASPVAQYIRKSPQVPLIKNFKQKKCLYGISPIPKFVQTSTVKQGNKENVDLPAIAYKNAKKTEVIDVTNEPKMPPSQWTTQLTNSLPRPVVLKHYHREKKDVENENTRSVSQQHSFDDLSMHQADVSFCTKKSGF